MNSRKLTLVIVMALILPGIVLTTIGVTEGKDIWGCFLNLGSELIGAVIAFLAIEKILGKKIAYEEDERLKKRLISRMKIPGYNGDNTEVLAALAELRAYGWHKTALKGEDFAVAYFRSANFEYADLSNSKLESAHMHSARLFRADLSGANLANAVLQHAQLGMANLEKTIIAGADLSGAMFLEANLRYANLGEGAYVADFDENTTLPNGDHWKPGYDMTKFTNPSHAEFWQPAWVHYMESRHISFMDLPKTEEKD